MKPTRSIAAIWKATWREAVARPEIARGLDRARLPTSARGAFAQRFRDELLPRVEPEAQALRAIELRERGTFVRRLVETNVMLLSGLFLLRLDLNLIVLAIVLGLLVLASLILILDMAGVMPATADRARARDQLRAKIAVLLVPHLRRTINARLRVPFDRLVVRDTAGLSEVVDPSLEVPTRARERLVTVMRGMSAGTIGISGARGAGKSTLIRAACDGRLPLGGARPTLGVQLAAPVEWKASEFVPFLFAELCARVSASLRDEERPSPRASLARLLTAYGAVGVVYGLAAGSVLMWRADELPTVQAQHAVAVGLGLGAFTAAVRLSPMISRSMADALAASARRRRPALRRVELGRLAARRLRELRVRETVVRGWSLGAAPAFLSLGGKHEATATEQPLTLPEVVGRYKAFVRRVAEHSTLVVGIDELDKMESAEAAARFLAEVKVLFGEQPCFYLVSLSDDAMSEFERRGVPLRTVFDSTFDEVLHVDTLSFEESREIVEGRIVGMGEAHTAVCHVLGDGIPRELIRCVRAAIEASEQGARTPTEVAGALVAERLRRIERAIGTAAARHVGVDGRHPLLDWLARLPPAVPGTLAARWDLGVPYAALAEYALGEPERVAQRLMLLELAAVAYRGATTVELATLLDDDALAAITRPVEPSPVLTLLARAGRDLSLGPPIAWQTVDEAREEIGLACIPFPVEELDVGPTTVAEPEDGWATGWRRLLGVIESGQ